VFARGRNPKGDDGKTSEIEKYPKLSFLLF
jgi:hypothetical protein